MQSRREALTVVITGRVPLLLLVGLVPLVGLGGFGSGWAVGTLLAWLALVLLLIGIDVAVAASPRLVLLERTLPTAVRLGEPAEARLLVTNAGPRAIHGILRDAWHP
ncbi:MAG TPA: DUF58 domain-containing protein, partial [Amnibacterium sp.]